MSEPLTTEADHVAYLLVVLFSAGVMPEERFDRLALDHLRRHGLTGRLKAMKEQMLLSQEAYRLELRGKPYLCRTRLAGVTDAQGRPTVVAYDVVQLLERLSAVVKEPPKVKPAYYD